MGVDYYFNPPKDDDGSYTIGVAELSKRLDEEIRLRDRRQKAQQEAEAKAIQETQRRDQFRADDVDLLNDRALSLTYTMGIIDGLSTRRPSPRFEEITTLLSAAKFLIEEEMAEG